MIGTSSGPGVPGPISAVREGMRVVDSSGEDIGTVAEVRMSDPGSVTSQGQATDADGLLRSVADAIAGGDALPEHERERLTRLGYVRIDARGLFAGDRYAASDEIAGVTGESVQLGVDGGRLIG